MEKIIITKEIMLAASDYMTLQAKEEWTEKVAPRCFDKLGITADDEPLPPMYMVNMGLKNRYLMAALAQYLMQPYEPDETDESLMSRGDYDKWAGSHVFCQIDRLKACKEARDKCYDLLYDFHELEKMLSAQLNGLLTVQNDYVIRQNEYTATQIKELPQVIEQLKNLQEGRENG